MTQQINVSKYGDIIPPLGEFQYNALKESIVQFGLLESIIINQSGDILDGHHRYKICTELGISPSFKTKQFDDESLELIFVIEINLIRRHLYPYQKIELASIYEKLESKAARKRQQEGGNQLPLRSIDLKGQARDIAARKAGLSGKTYQRGKFIMQHGSESIKKALRNDEVSIHYAYKQVMRELDSKNRRNRKLASITTETKEENKKIESQQQDYYDVILADPPWQYSMNFLGSPDLHYAVMSDEEIEKIDVPSSKDAILFLWATAPKLDDALDVMEAWGFEYKTHAIWVKPRSGTGYYFRGRHELLLVGVKGDGIGIPAESDRFDSVFEAKRERHSKKPDLVYEMIERMYPGREYLELFARGKPREGWKTWGFEVDGGEGGEEEDNNLPVSSNST